MLTGKKLKTIERLIDDADVVGLIEERLATGGRPRQLPVRTLLVGILGAYLDRRGPRLSGVHKTLLGLPASHRERLGVRYRDSRTSRMRNVTYRQIEYLFGRVMSVLDSSPIPKRRSGESKEAWMTRVEASRPDATVSAEAEERLVAVCDSLLEASIPSQYKPHDSYAVDWTDVNVWSRGRRTPTDPTAAWGRRRSKSGGGDEMYFGFVEQAVTMVSGEDEPPMPELVRRVTLSPANARPTLLIAPALEGLIKREGIEPGDLLADSAYPHTKGWTLLMNQQGWSLVVDLHPSDRGPKGTYKGAIDADGQLYCPATPAGLFTVVSGRPDATEDEIEALIEERNRYAFQPKGKPDADGYRRWVCPAAAAKVRCPNVPESLAGSPEKPTVDTSSQASLPYVCEHRSTTFPPTVNEKTRQKHPYKSKRWEVSYARRTAVERSFGRLKDRDGENLERGDSIKMFGRARYLLLRTFAYMKQNLRLVKTYMKTLRKAKKASQRAVSEGSTRARQRTETTDQRLEELGVSNLASPT